MSTIKMFKKGEFLFREGEPAKTVYLIQSGSVTLQLSRQKQTIDLCIVGPQQVVGEHALSGATTHPHGAICTAETKVIELPVDAVRTQIDASSQLTKVLTKGLSDKLRVVLRELQSVRLERDNSPCPPEQTAKAFGSLFHAASLKAGNWPAMKQYAQRVFLESPKRMEQAATIFVKLGVASFEMTHNEEDDVEEIGFIRFTDLPLVEQFFEFYQYYFFKGGKTELLKTDDRVMQLTSHLIDLASSLTPDRQGLVRLDYVALVERIREKMGLALNADHFSLLEAKGLFVKRQTVGEAVTLSFEFAEFQRTLKIWRVLREVERWNEKGFVDLNEPVEIRTVRSASCECPSCKKPQIEGAKFCSECGQRLSQAA